MAEIATYRYNTGTNVLPTFNSGFTYEYTDINNGDGTTSRIITSSTLPTSISFANNSNLKSVYYIEASGLTSMNCMFQNCTGLTYVEAGTWDVSNVTDMTGLFRDCISLYEIVDIKNWDVRKVTNLDMAFHNLHTIPQLDLSGWQLDSLTRINDYGQEAGGLFSMCTNLQYLYLGDGWNMSKVTDISRTFYACENLQELHINNWDVSNATTTEYMFSNCFNLKRLNLSKWNVSKVTNMREMFALCSKLSNLDLQDWTFASNVDITNAFNHDVPLLRTIKCNVPASINRIASALASRNNNEWGVVITTNTSGVDQITLNNKYWYIQDYGSCLLLADYKFDDRIFNDFLPHFNTETTGDLVCYFTEDVYEETEDLVIENEITNDVIPARLVIPKEHIVRRRLKTIGSRPEKIRFGHRDKSTGEANFPAHGNVYAARALLSLSFLDLAETTNEITDLFRYCIRMVSCSGIVTSGLIGHFGCIFENCMSIKEILLSGIKNTNGMCHLGYAFASCYNVKKIDITGWNTSRVYGFNHVFHHDHCLTEIIGLDQLNTGSMIGAEMMFDCCYKLEYINVENWDTKNLTNLSYTFCDCKSLKYLNVSKWNTQKLVNTIEAFAGCESLVALDVSDWNMSNVITPAGMFKNCSKLVHLDVSKWNTSAFNTLHTIFLGCRSLRSLDVGNWNISNVADLYCAFKDCEKLEKLDVSNWNVSNVRWAERTFDGCISLKKLDVSKWETPVLEAFNGVFQDCKSLEKLDLSSWNTSNVVNMGSAFSNCMNLVELNIESFDTRKTTNIAYMFANCRKLPVINVSHFNTSSLDSLECVFENCHSLGTLDLSHWDVSRCKRFIGVFNYCTSLKYLNLKGWDTKSALDMSWMFHHCESLEELEITHFDTSKVENMYAMFWNCRALQNLNVSSFDTRKVIKLGSIFGQMYNLKVLNMNNILITDVNAYDKRILDGSNNLNKVYINDIKTLEHFLPFLPDRTGKTAGVLVTSLRDKITTDMSSQLSALNWTISDVVVQYIFDSRIKQNLLPTFNSGFTSSNYTIEDEKLSSGFVNRTIISKSSGTLPTLMRFGLEGDTTANDTTKSLYKVCDLNTKNLTDLSSMFRRCPNLNQVCADWNTSKATLTYDIFAECTALKHVEVGNFDMSNVTDAHGMFYGCEKVPTLNVRNWNMSKVTNMSYLFWNCRSITGTIDVNHWDVSKCTKTYKMFSDCRNLTYIDISKWDTSLVSDMTYMFESCENLRKVDVSGVAFQSTNANYFFKNLEEKDKLTTVKAGSATSVNSLIQHLPDRTGLASGLVICDSSSGLNVSGLQAKNWAYMLSSSMVLVADYKYDNRVINLLPQFNDDINFDYFVVDTFEDTSTLTLKGVVLPSDDIDNLELEPDEIYSYISGTHTVPAANIVRRKVYTTNVAYLPTSIHFGLIDFDHHYDHSPDGREKALLEVNYVNTSKLFSFEKMFRWCAYLHKVNASNWITRQVLNANYMFSECFNLKTLDLSTWKMHRVKELFNTFNSCQSLTSINMTGWDDRYIENMDSTFNYCVALTTITGIDNWTLKKNKTLKRTFSNCAALTSLSTSNWDTSKVVDMSYTFNNCHALTSINVSNFDTSNVTYKMDRMFCCCKKITSINVSNFNTGQVISFEKMFYGCEKLTSLNISNFKLKNVTQATDIVGGTYTALTSVTLGSATLEVINHIIKGLPTKTSGTNILDITREKLIAGIGTMKLDLATANTKKWSIYYRDINKDLDKYTSNKKLVIKYANKNIAQH